MKHRTGRRIVWVLICLGITSCSRSPSEQAAVNDVPPDAERLREQAIQSLRRQDSVQCVGLFEKLLAISADSLDQLQRRIDLLNAFSCNTLARKRDQAFAYLEQAIQMGFGFDGIATIESDPEYKEIVSDPRWSPLVAGIKSKAFREQKERCEELLRLFQEDQADRASEHDKSEWQEIAKRDDRRLAMVQNLLAQGKAKVSVDFYHAAMVFHHGQTVEHFQMAQKLARHAVELDPQNADAKWLYAAAVDRELMKQGKPQKYGTQVQVIQGKSVLYQCCDPSVTDEERARWNVRPLAQLKKDIDEMSIRCTKPEDIDEMNHSSE